MVNGLSILGEPRLFVADHSASVSVDSQEITHVALLRLAVAALPALARENGEDMVSRLKFRDALANALDDSSARVVGYLLCTFFTSVNDTTIIYFVIQ